MVALLTRNCIYAKLLKLKDGGDTCPNRMASKYRVHSVFIMEHLKEIHRGVTTIAECVRMCGEAGSPAECAYFAYHAADQQCLFLDTNLHSEVISRFLFQGWVYGRNLVPSKRVNLFLHISGSTDPLIVKKKLETRPF